MFYAQRALFKLSILKCLFGLAKMLVGGADRVMKKTPAKREKRTRRNLKRKEKRVEAGCRDSNKKLRHRVLWSRVLLHISCHAIDGISFRKIINESLLSSYLKYRCNCNTGYTGQNCESQYVPCSPSPCQNGGSCKAIDKLNYECRCPPGNNNISFSLSLRALQRRTKKTRHPCCPLFLWQWGVIVKSVKNMKRGTLFVEAP